MCQKSKSIYLCVIQDAKAFDLIERTSCSGETEREMKGSVPIMKIF